MATPTETEKPPITFGVQSPTDTEPEPEPEPEPDEAPKVPTPPPNGGVVAWLHVLGGFLLFFNSWGVLSGFGVFQTYYESGDLFEASSSDISWIGAIQYFVAMLTGLVAGPAYDRGYLRVLLVIGTICVVLGHMMLSLCQAYWQVVLAEGIMIGIGAGCLFLSCISVLPSYFSTRLGLASGIAASGSAFGGIIYPIVLYRIMNNVGFSWAVRIIGFIALGTLLVPLAVMRMRFKPSKPRSFIDWTAFREAQYMFLVLAILLGCASMIILNSYISFLSKDKHLVDTSLAFYIVSVFNAASFFGRIIPNFFADTTGPFNILGPFLFITGIISFCMIPVHTEPGVIIVTILLGFFVGVQTSMPPVCFAQLTQDKSKIGTRIGMGYAISGLGYFVGGPPAGAILGRVDPLDWTDLWVYCGVLTCVSGLTYAGVRISRSGWRLIAKA